MAMVERCIDLAGDEVNTGYVQLVSGFMFPQQEGERSWIKERLVAMDTTSHSYVYKMEASKVGLDGYVNSLKLSSNHSSYHSRNVSRPPVDFERTG